MSRSILCTFSGIWLAFRAVNLPQFADFLISVEAEMDKVTWSSRQELYRATVVVITTMVLLGAILLLYDFHLGLVFHGDPHPQTDGELIRGTAFMP